MTCMGTGFWPGLGKGWGYGKSISKYSPDICRLAGCLSNICRMFSRYTPDVQCVTGNIQWIFRGHLVDIR